jgi:hypothetical protein
VVVVKRKGSGEEKMSDAAQDRQVSEFCIMSVSAYLDPEQDNG